MSSRITTHTSDNSFVHRVYHASNDKEVAAVYAEWAASYDTDMGSSSVDYVAPQVVAAALVENLDDLHTNFLDAGCGTGLAGLAVAARLGQRKSSSQAHTFTIDGVDLSDSMLEVASKTKIYRNLKQANLNEPLPSTDSSYDAVFCVGALTHGHIKAGAIGEFARVTRTNGVIAATVLEDIWDSGGYRAEVDRLVEDDIVEVLESKLENYRRRGGVMARLLVLKKSGAATDVSSDTS